MDEKPDFEKNAAYVVGCTLFAIIVIASIAVVGLTLLGPAVSTQSMNIVVSL